MKRFIVSLAAIAISSLAFAQTPNSFNYQAVVRGSDGKVLQNSNVSFRFSILENSATGTSVYVETQSVMTNQFGLVNMVIGDGIPVSGSMESINWSTESHFLKVDMDVNGGSAFTDMTVQQLISVPYALHAGTVSNSDNDTTNEYQQLSKSGSTISLSDGGGDVILDDDDASNEIQSINRSGNDLILSDGGGTVSIADDDNDPANELQQLSFTNDTLSLSGSAVKISLEPLGYWTRSGNSLYANAGTVGVGMTAPNTSYKLDIYSDTSMLNNLEVYNDVNSSGTAINGYFRTDRTTSSLGNTYGLYNFLEHNPGSGGFYNAIGSYNYVSTAPDNSSGLQTYGTYQNVFRSDSGQGSTTGDFLSLVHSGNDGAIFGSYQSVFGSGDNPDPFYGNYRDFGITGNGFGGSVYGSWTRLRRASSVSATSPSTNFGNTVGSHLSLINNPKTGVYHTYGSEMYIDYNPDNAATGNLYGDYKVINRGDSGSGITYGYYLDINQTGNDGPVYGSALDIDVTGFSNDYVYGQYTNVRKRGIGSMYGNYTYTFRSNGYGNTYGNFNYINASPDSGSSTYTTHGNHTVLLGNPGVDIEMVGDNLDVTRGGTAIGPTYGRSDNISHSGLGTLHGYNVEISRTSTKSLYTTYGLRSYIDGIGGSAYGVQSQVFQGNSSSTTTGTIYGGYFYARREGNLNASSYGARNAGYNYTTGTGSRYAYGTYSYALQNSANGSSYTYGIYSSLGGSGDIEYGGYFSGNVYTTGSYLPSDKMLKSGIEACPSSLDRVLELNIYNYNYKTEKYAHMNLPEGRQTGFMAQEMKEIFPELTAAAHQPPMDEETIEQFENDGIVVTDEERTGLDFIAVNYAGLVPHLTKAIQEQQAIIERQQTEIEAMKKEMVELRKLIENPRQ